MARLIKDKRIASDPWLLLKPGADGSLPAVPAAGDVIVPLAVWQAQRDSLRLRNGHVGVWLDSHQEASAIASDLGALGVIAVNFPKFGDGRGYSTARLLRDRYGWKGELRAIGDVFRDTLFQLHQCGFNAFELRAGEDSQEALGALGTFSDTYQATVEQPLPLFRRRQTA